MQNWTAFVIFLAALVFDPIVASAQSLKIGTVDMKAVVEAYQKTKEFRAAVNEVLEVNKQELIEFLDADKTTLQDVNRLDRALASADLSPSARTIKQKLRDEKAAVLHDSERKRRGIRETGDLRMRERLDRLRANLFNEVSGIVAREARDNDYAIVFDASGTSTPGWPTVLYSRDTFDFTDRVITALKKRKGWEIETLPAPPPLTDRPR